MDRNCSLIHIVSEKLRQWGKDCHLPSMSRLRNIKVNNAISLIASGYLKNGFSHSASASICTLISSLPSSSSCILLLTVAMVAPHMCSATAKSRSIFYVCPAEWNCLPQSTRLEILAITLSQFRKTRLQTFLLAGQDTNNDRESCSWVALYNYSIILHYSTTVLDIP